MFIDEQDVMLEARIEVRLESQFDNDRIVVAVYVGIYSVQTLEHITEKCWERFWERYADTRRKHLFVVDVCLNPGHEMFDILRSRHLCRLLKVFVILPEVFKSIRVSIHNVET